MSESEEEGEEYEESSPEVPREEEDMLEISSDQPGTGEDTHDVKQQSKKDTLGASEMFLAAKAKREKLALSAMEARNRKGVYNLICITKCTPHCCKFWRSWFQIKFSWEVLLTGVVYMSRIPPHLVCHFPSKHTDRETCCQKNSKINPWLNKANISMAAGCKTWSFKEQSKENASQVLMWVGTCTVIKIQD